MSLFNGEWVYPTVAQFYKVGLPGGKPVSVTEGGLWYDFNTFQYKAIIKGVITPISGAGVVIPGGPYDVTSFAPGVGTNNQIMLRIGIPRSVTFPAGAALSIAIASIAATASTTFTLKKNGGAFATVNFGIGATTGTWTQATDAVFAAGDILENDGPATSDTTLANIGFTLVGVRN